MLDQKVLVRGDAILGALDVLWFGRVPPRCNGDVRSGDPVRFATVFGLDLQLVLGDESCSSVDQFYSLFCPITLVCAVEDLYPSMSLLDEGLKIVRYLSIFIAVMFASLESFVDGSIVPGHFLGYTAAHAISIGKAFFWAH